MSDSYRIRILVWRASDGELAYQADVYRPGEDYISISPTERTRDGAEGAARAWIAADRTASLPEPEWIEVP